MPTAPATELEAVENKKKQHISVMLPQLSLENKDLRILVVGEGQMQTDTSFFE